MPTNGCGVLLSDGVAGLDGPLLPVDIPLIGCVVMRPPIVFCLLIVQVQVSCPALHEDDRVITLGPLGVTATALHVRPAVRRAMKRPDALVGTFAESISNDFVVLVVPETNVCHLAAAVCGTTTVKIIQRLLLDVRQNVHEERRTFRMAHNRRKALVRIMKILGRQRELLQIITALRAPRSFARGLNRRQQQRNQYADNRDDHQQLHKGEPPS